MRKRHLVAAIGAVLSVGGGSAFAYSGIGFSGGLCAPWVHAVSQPNTDGFHMQDGQLNCQISYPPNTTQTFAYNSIQMDMYDSSGTVTNRCFPHTNTSAAGVTFFGPTKYTCSTWGGCPDSTSAYQGPAYLFWNATESFLGTSSGSLNVVYDFSTTGVKCFVGHGTVQSYRFATW
jgi:hypothetical protein